MLFLFLIFNFCVFNGRVCEFKNFILFSYFDFSWCYILNFGFNGYFLINVLLVGVNFGLKLLLNIERDSYVENLIVLFVGFLVLVYD